MSVYNLVSLSGVFLLAFIAWIFSTDRRRVNLKLVVVGLLLQFSMGAFVFLFPPGTQALLFLSHITVKIIEASSAGIEFVFGPLGLPPGTEGSPGFILAFQALPTIIFFSALMGLLYYFRVMPFIIKLFAKVFTKLLGISGAESLCTTSNIFVGIEANTTVLPYLNQMTRSELHTILTAGMATIASSVMGIYVLLLQSHFPNIAGHLISASLISAPASIVMSKILLPETERPITLGTSIEPHYEREGNWMEAIINGATAGGKLVMGIIVLLVAFLGMVRLLNMGIGSIGGIHLETILAYPFYPLSLAIGVPPSDAMEIARLLGERMILTEIPAYQHLNDLLAHGALHDGRSAVIAAYALCGFAHLSSVAIFVGGTAALVPERTLTLAQIAMRSFLAATLACLMTAAVAGTFYGKGSLLFLAN
ncbi:MAG: nucleoside transporter [Deltaproteobacteria bacterium]|nr:nucleoside transporter [Deltaproteobacteria bacterium]